MLTKQKKDRIIEKFKTHAHDTGSSQVQIAILSEEIKELAKHLKQHPHDHSSRRGLIRKVNERKKLLKYLRKEDLAEWEKLVKALKLKVAKDLTEEETPIVEEEISLPVEAVEEKVEPVTDDAP